MASGAARESSTLRPTCAVKTKLVAAAADALLACRRPVAPTPLPPPRTAHTVATRASRRAPAPAIRAGEVIEPVRVSRQYA